MDEYGCFGFDSSLLASMSLEAERCAHEEALDWDYEEEEEKRQMIAEQEAEDAAYEAYITEAHEAYMESLESHPEADEWEFAEQWEAQFAR